MQVYNTYFKVIKKNISEMIIYIIVFLFFAIFVTQSGTASQNAGFTETKNRMAFINNDNDSILADGLYEHLNNHAKLINIEDDKQELQDALFYRDVEYVVRVPDGFTDGFLEGKAVHLEKSTVPDSAAGIYLDNLINKYLNTAKMYVHNTQNISDTELVNLINKDLASETEVNLDSMKDENTGNNSQFYFNFLSYSLFAILILGVCSVMLSFNNRDLKKRNLSSPIKLKSFNLQLVFANIMYAIIVWFILIAASFVMYGKYMLTANGFLYLLNSFIFNLAALSISFLISNIVKSRGAMSAASNVVALGTCFISGVFVPQELLGKTVLNIASFTPTYWYVKANDQIAGISSFNMDSLTPILTDIFIVLGFAVAILLVTLVVMKQKRMSN